MRPHVHRLLGLDQGKRFDHLLYLLDRRLLRVWQERTRRRSWWNHKRVLLRIEFDASPGQWIRPRRDHHL